MNSFVIDGLVKRRAELAGDIEKTHETLRKMVLDLESLDATILQFDLGIQRPIMIWICGSETLLDDRRTQSG